MLRVQQPNRKHDVTVDSFIVYLLTAFVDLFGVTASLNWLNSISRQGKIYRFNSISMAVLKYWHAFYDAICLDSVVVQMHQTPKSSSFHVTL